MRSDVGVSGMPAGARGLSSGSRGSVTAEMAVALPTLVLMVAAGIWLVSAVLAQARCVDAAREAARALARGDDLSVARQAARRTAPAGASVTISVSGRLVEVTVRGSVAPIGGLSRRLVPATVSARATTELEPGQ